ncbi:LysE family translocator [Vibrio sp. H11]|uniref:LysE family translocator n=1 Tax=Vibrio sp. H11 TaxID=2565928 RepID=UPI0010A66CF8|nr:LysE family translocator [Vibrio sp. H11]
MDIELWLAFALAYLLITLSPGPNVILVLKNGMQYGWRSALVTILGNLSCQLIVVTLVAVGIGGLLAQLPAWFLVMKCLGGAYLIYLGIKSLCASRASTLDLTQTPRSQAKKSARSLGFEAFLVSASNPKTLIFLSAFLPQFLDVAHPPAEQFTIMYLTICVIVTAVHLGYAVVISRFDQRLKSHRLQHYLAKCIGGIFITMGGGVLLSSRS